MELFHSSSRKRRLEIFPFFFLLNTTAVFPPQIRGLIRGQDLFEFRFFSLFRHLSFSSHERYTFFNYIHILELQLTTGKERMFFNVGRIFLFFYQLFPSRRSSFVSLKKKRKISPPLFYPSSRRGES